MGIISDIFGTKKDFSTIEKHMAEEGKDFDKDVQEELVFISRLEKYSKKKVKLAQKFTKSWDKGHLEELKTYIFSIKQDVIEGQHLLKKFNERVKNESDELLDAMHVINIKLKKDASNVWLCLTRLKKLGNLEKISLDKQMDFFDEVRDDLVLQKSKIADLIELIVNEGEILENGQKVVQELKYRSELIRKHESVEQMEKQVSLRSVPIYASHVLRIINDEVDDIKRGRKEYAINGFKLLKYYVFGDWVTRTVNWKGAYTAVLTGYLKSEFQREIDGEKYVGLGSEDRYNIAFGINTTNYLGGFGDCTFLYRLQDIAKYGQLVGPGKKKLLGRAVHCDEEEVRVYPQRYRGEFHHLRVIWNELSHIYYTLCDLLKQKVIDPKKKLNELEKVLRYNSDYKHLLYLLDNNIKKNKELVKIAKLYPELDVPLDLDITLGDMVKKLKILLEKSRRLSLNLNLGLKIPINEAVLLVPPKCQLPLQYMLKRLSSSHYPKLIIYAYVSKEYDERKEILKHFIK